MEYFSVRVALYTVFFLPCSTVHCIYVFFPSPQNLVKTLAKPDQKSGQKPGQKSNQEYDQKFKKSKKVAVSKARVKVCVGIDIYCSCDESAQICVEYALHTPLICIISCSI